LAGFDRGTLVALLAQRPEFSEQEINDVINSVEESWASVLHAPQQLATQAQEKYEDATHAIAEYLRNTGKPELSPEGIKRDLQKLMDHPRAGAQAIRYRLSKMDQDTLVQLLSQRGDMNEEELNQTIDSLLNSIQSLVKSPRRLARRATSQAQAQAKSFQSALEDYLSNTNKESLNPEGIKRDFKLLLSDPKLGASKLGDRLMQMDDSTMVALLAQRGDMTEAEAAEVVGRITDVRHQVKDQIRSIQRSVESVIDGIFTSIRDYLESLDRPELDYYGIKRDVRTLFDDPQAGFGALRDRLSQFDRDTLVALISSHDRISERDANRVIDQIESARDGVLRKAESVEQQIESRIHAVKAQTQKQIEDTKKAAEAAAWWLFGTAFLSAIVAVVGGLIAVV
jgi:nucleoid DNA-binding protein